MAGQRVGAHASLTVDRHPDRTRSRPSPSRPSALTSDGCTSSPTITVTGGAPTSPCSSTSQPARASTACRAAASAVRLAIGRAGHEARDRRRRQAEELEQPALRHLLERRGHRRGREGAGVLVPRRGQPVRPPRPTGSEPPMTKPKNRGPAEAIVAGEPASSSSAITRSGSEGCVRQRLVEALQPDDRVDLGRDAALGQLAQVPDRPLGGRAQQLLAHAAASVRRRRGELVRHAGDSAPPRRPPRRRARAGRTPRRASPAPAR